jgi:hypothetical protein
VIVGFGVTVITTELDFVVSFADVATIVTCKVEVGAGALNLAVIVV